MDRFDAGQLVFAAVLSLVYFAGIILQLKSLVRAGRRFSKHNFCQVILRRVRDWCFPSGPVSDAVCEARLRYLHQHINIFALIFLIAAVRDGLEVLDELDRELDGFQMITVMGPALQYLACCCVVSRPTLLCTRRLRWVSVMCALYFTSCRIFFRPGYNVMFVCNLGLVAGVDIHTYLLYHVFIMFTGLPIRERDDYWIARFVSGVGAALIYNWMLAKQSVEHLRLKSSEDAGEALCMLLNAEYDAVVELDDSMCVTHASKTFFGMVGMPPPIHHDAISKQLLRILPTHVDVSAPRESAALVDDVEATRDKDKLVTGRSFPATFLDEEDEALLSKSMEEQRSMWHATRDGTQHDDSQSNLATTLSVRMRAESKVVSTFNLYCAACLDRPSRRFRYMIAIREMGEMAQAPEAELAVQAQDLPGVGSLHICSGLFDFAQPDWPLLDDTRLGMLELKRGTRLATVFNPSLLRDVQTFVNLKMANYRLGLLRHRRWVFGKVTGVFSAPQESNRVAFELRKDTDKVVAIAITVEPIDQESQPARSSRSASSERSSKGFVPSLKSLPEAEAEAEGLEPNSPPCAGHSAPQALLRARNSSRPPPSRGCADTCEEAENSVAVIIPGCEPAEDKPGESSHGKRPSPSSRSDMHPAVIGPAPSPEFQAPPALQARPVHSVIGAVSKSSSTMGASKLRI